MPRATDVEARIKAMQGGKKPPAKKTAVKPQPWFLIWAGDLSAGEVRTGAKIIQAANEDAAIKHFVGTAARPIKLGTDLKVQNLGRAKIYETTVSPKK